MKIAALIQRLQEIRLDHGDVDVVVGLDEREVDEHNVAEVSYAEPVEELGIERRCLITLDWSAG